MNSIFSVMNKEIPLFDYQIKVGHVLAAAAVIGAIKAWMTYQKEGNPANHIHSSAADKNFWQQFNIQTAEVNKQAPIQFMGKRVFSSLEEAQKEMALACTKPSDFVLNHLYHSDFKGSVLDLGSGIGANSTPLALKGWQVTVIEIQKEILEKSQEIEKGYRNNKHLPIQNFIERTCIHGDITEVAYPEGVDAIICVDVLPYLPPSKLKKTLEKINKSLRPGGKFIGTLFFKNDSSQGMIRQFIEKLGGYYLPDSSMIQQILVKSGFEVCKAQEREDEPNHPSECIEFLAIKPH